MTTATTRPGAVPTEDAIDASTTLPELRTHEANILAATRTHEDEVARLQNLYTKVRKKMYRDHKLAVIAEDNAKLQRFQGGCSKPKEASLATKAELDKQADCMQQTSREIDNSDLGLLMRRHLKPPVAALPAGATCAPFRQLDLSQLSRHSRACLSKAGDARWTADGLVDAPEAAAATEDAAAAAAAATAAAAPPPANASGSGECGRHWVGTAETRCLLGGKNLVFFGNSVVRRQMVSERAQPPSRPAAQLPSCPAVQLPSCPAAARAKRPTPRSRRPFAGCLRALPAGHSPPTADASPRLAVYAARPARGAVGAPAAHQLCGRLRADV